MKLDVLQFQAMNKNIIIIFLVAFLALSCSSHIEDNRVLLDSIVPSPTSMPLPARVSSTDFDIEALVHGWVSYGKVDRGELYGYLTIPSGKGPFPAVIFNHGSKYNPEPKRAISKYFTDQGYVVFLPDRRGYGNSDGPDLAEALYLDANTDEGRVQLFDRLRDETEDVLTALSFIKSQKFVDPRRIVMSGYSFGGITTLIAASNNTDFVAGIAFSTAAGTWKHGGIYRQQLIDTVREAKVPLLFIYAENDYDLSPGIVFSRELRRLQKPVTLKIYPPFGETEQDAHEIALKREGIKIWGQDVKTFLDKWVPAR